MASNSAQAFLANLETAECAICKEPFSATHLPVQSPSCVHMFGADCLRAWVNANQPNSNRCPGCREPLYIAHPQIPVPQPLNHRQQPQDNGNPVSEEPTNPVARSEQPPANPSNYQLPTGPGGFIAPLSPDRYLSASYFGNKLWGALIVGQRDHPFWAELWNAVWQHLRLGRTHQGSQRTTPVRNNMYTTMTSLLIDHSGDATIFQEYAHHMEHAHQDSWSEEITQELRHLLHTMMDISILVPPHLFHSIHTVNSIFFSRISMNLLQEPHLADPQLSWTLFNNVVENLREDDDSLLLLLTMLISEHSLTALGAATDESWGPSPTLGRLGQLAPRVAQRLEQRRHANLRHRLRELKGTGFEALRLWRDADAEDRPGRVY